MSIKCEVESESIELRKRVMSRHPYTHASDMIRTCPGVSFGPEGVKLTRADAVCIRKEIAKAIGMSDEELAEKLSLHYQKNSSEWAVSMAKRMLVAPIFEDGTGSS